MARKRAEETGTRQPASRRSPAAPRRRTPRAAKSETPKSVTSPPARTWTESQIRERAYYIYLERGRGGRLGDALGDWVQAEHEFGAATNVTRS